MDKSYKLVWGIHRYTLTSRDTGKPKDFATREDAIKEFEAFTLPPGVQSQRVNSIEDGEKFILETVK